MALVKCGQCKGGGTVPGGSCQGCGGDGHVRVADPPTTCGQGKGSGRMPGKQCPGCGGRGRVRD